MKSIDPDVLADYNAGIEKNRLHEGLGLIEFERTRELLLEFLPPPPAVIYDIGGGYGEYSYFLASLGYEVELYDLSEEHIRLAKEMGKERHLSLRRAQVADARRIDRPAASADAILLMGPLYHIVESYERSLCLQECARLLKPGGLLFTAAITRYATTLWAVSTYDQNHLLDEPAFCEMIRTEIASGDHIKNPASRYRGIGRSYFHLPQELKEEIEKNGFSDATIHGVVGPCWLIPQLDHFFKDPILRENILKIVRLLEKEASLLGLSTHLLGIAKKA